MPAYDPPMSLKEVLSKHPHLADDPVHLWRAEQGIELIHPEPTPEELERIAQNWELMDDEQKRISDEKSMELFGMINADHLGVLKQAGEETRDTVIERLTKAKEHSDAGHYTPKHVIMRQLLTEVPEEFVVDTEDEHHPGITHTPSGFKMHVPKHLAAMIGGKDKQAAGTIKLSFDQLWHLLGEELKSDQEKRAADSRMGLDTAAGAAAGGLLGALIGALKAKAHNKALEEGREQGEQQSAALNALGFGAGGALAGGGIGAALSAMRGNNVRELLPDTEDPNRPFFENGKAKREIVIQDWYKGGDKSSVDPEDYLKNWYKHVDGGWSRVKERAVEATRNRSKVVARPGSTGASTVSRSEDNANDLLDLSPGPYAELTKKIIGGEYPKDHNLDMFYNVGPQRGNFLNRAIVRSMNSVNGLETPDGDPLNRRISQQDADSILMGHEARHQYQGLNAFMTKSPIADNPNVYIQRMPELTQALGQLKAETAFLTGKLIRNGQDFRQLMSETGVEEADPLKLQNMQQQYTPEGSRMLNYMRTVRLTDPEGYERLIEEMNEKQMYDQVAAFDSSPETDMKMASAAIPMTGPEAIVYALKNMNLDEIEREQRAVLAKGSKTKRGHATRVLGIIQGLRRNELEPRDLMITKVPLLPPAFRPFNVVGTTFIPGDANELYKDLDSYRKSYHQVRSELGDDGAKEAWKDLRQSVKAVYGHGESPNPKTAGRGVSGFLQAITGVTGKYGFVQRKLLSKPQDSVARATIIPDPELHMDQVGIPHDAAWPTYSSHVQRRMVRSGMAPIDALRNIKERSPSALKALEMEMAERPVILSRAPAWHRTNCVGSWPRLVDGDAIRISPMIATGCNADYDGDQCVNQLYACIPREAVQAWRMSYHNLDSHEVRFPAGSNIPVLQDANIYLFDLEDFPHGEMLSTKQGAKGRIDFHSIPAPIKVLAYDEKTGELLWSDVSAWSKHYSREIEIVDTHNGYQLVTDDDPRAVYGVAAGSLEFDRFTPTDALAAKVLIPRSKHVPAPQETVTTVTGCNACGKTATRMVPTIGLESRVGWLLGAMTGDGWVCKSDGKPVRFDFADNEGFNQVKLQSVLPAIFAGILPACNKVVCESDEPGRYGDTVSYRYSSSNAAEWFRSLIGGERDENTAGSANKHLPPFYLSATKEFRSGLLCGLIDTDGSIAVSSGKTKPQLMANFSSTSLRLVQETKLLAMSLGISGRITPGKTPLGKDCWQLSFCNYEFQAWGAPYMAHEDKLTKLRSVPKIETSPVTCKYDIVPMPSKLARDLSRIIGNPKMTPAVKADAVRKAQVLETNSLYMTLVQTATPKHSKFGAISRDSALRVIDRLGRDKIAEQPLGIEWLRVVYAEDVTWERVTAVQRTGIREDGYDLTVPGYETFMSADGIILSNTMTMHVPVSKDAVDETINKLMPSKMPFSIRNPDKIVPTLKHEQILGLYDAQNTPSKKTWKFENQEDAMAAIHNGTVSLSDEVEFPSMPSSK